MTWQYATPEIVHGYDGPMTAVDRQPTTVAADILAFAGELAEHLGTPDDVRGLTAALRAPVERLPRGVGQRGKDLPMPLAELLQCLAGRRAAAARRTIRVPEAAARRPDHGDQVALAARLARDDPAVAEIERSRFGVVCSTSTRTQVPAVLLRSCTAVGTR